MVESPMPRTWFRLPAPRFSLRALFGVVLLIGVAIPLGQWAWRRCVLYRDARQYAALQSAKNWGHYRSLAADSSDGSDSHSVDGGRGIPDDYVILVRRGQTFGCFIPRQQFKAGESARFDWYYREDGGGKLDPSDSNVKSGRGFSGAYVPGSGQSPIVKFGPFAIEWSGNGPGWGFLYHQEPGGQESGSRGQEPVSAGRADVLRICTTDVKDVRLIDARDPRWFYKSTANDPGLAGDKDEGESGARPANAQGGVLRSPLPLGEG